MRTRITGEDLRARKPWKTNCLTRRGREEACLCSFQEMGVQGVVESEEALAS